MVEFLQDKIQRAWRASWPLAAIAAVLAFAIWRFLVPRGFQNDTKPAVAGADSYRSQNPGVAFEPSDWALWPVGLVYVGILILLVVSSLVLMVAYPHALRDVERAVRIAPPGPRLQTDAEGDLRRFRAEEEKRLNSFYWVDKSQGIVHIPIGDAMRKLAVTGIPGFPKDKQ